MWRPDFEVAATHRATLRGYHRALCLSSRQRWGTEDAPGLVVGLIPGGQCEAMLLGVRAPHWSEVTAYLNDREGPGYSRVTCEIGLGEGRVDALTFVARPQHRDFVGELAPDEAARRILSAAPGTAGTAREYVESTAALLRQTGREDLGLQAVVDSLRQL